MAILELPANLQVAPQVLAVLNDRIRDINSAIAACAQNPSKVDLDLGKNRILNLADPKNDLDGVNLRTLQRFKAGVGEQQQQQVNGIDAYAIVFSKDGIVNDGDQAPGYAVQKLRQGVPVDLWVMAITAPASDCKINVSISLNGGLAKNVLTSDLVLPTGNPGPVYAGKLNYTPFMKEPSTAVLVIDKGGQAGGLSVGLVVKRKN